MRVTYVTQWFNEEQRQGLVGRFPAVLREAGMAVGCVTGPPLDLDDNTLPTGYQWWSVQREEREQLEILRCPAVPGHSTSSVARVAMYASFALSTTLLSAPELQRSDAVLVYASPATAAAAAMAATRRYGVPYVLMVQDVWPDSIFSSGFLTKRPARAAAEPLTERFVNASYRMAARITAISPGMKELLISRGVPQAKIDVVYNWADEAAYAEPVPVPVRQPEEPLTIMYAGNLGPPQGLDCVLNALERVPPGTARLVLAGGGVAEARLREQAARASTVDVRFLGRLTPQELKTAQQEAHIHLVSLRDEPLFRVTLPSKTQSLMCAGVPILAFAPGEVADIVTNAGAGIAAAPGNADALAHAIRTAYSWPPEKLAGCGPSARRAYFAEMSKGVNAARLVEAVTASTLLGARP